MSDPGSGFTGFFQFLQSNSDVIVAATVQHVLLSFIAVLAGTLAAVPLGIFIADRQRAARIFLSVTGTIQTIPSLALLALLLPLLGIGVMPAVVVLFLYSLLPILRNSYTGIQNVSHTYLEAGRGMGMNYWELLFMVRLPLALPVILTGIRISAVYILSWATLSALIGAGGLGDLIFAGIQTYDPNMILAGAIPTALLALLTSRAISRIENVLTPAGLRA